MVRISADPTGSAASTGRPHPSDRPTYRAWPLCDAIVELSTWLLPYGPLRDRYRREHQAELRYLDHRHQLRYTLGVLLSAWWLRRCVAGQGTGAFELGAPRKPLLCRLRLKHRWRQERSPDGDGIYWLCVRCGTEDAGSYADRVVDVIGGGSPAGGIG